MLRKVLDPKVAPSRPLLVYDADCNFCRYWAARWSEDASHNGQCIPLQDDRLAARFPQIPRKEWENAIHLIDTDGEVYSGAEAVFRFRAQNPRHRTLFQWYARSRWFAAIAESVYHIVSRHRSFFSGICGTHS
jgi:predicted DCC family thiol-disulfide oxidoreductase YuxK